MESAVNLLLKPLSDQIEDASGEIIYCAYRGFVTGGNSEDPLTYSDDRQKAKVFNDNEIDQIYGSLGLDRPLSETSILTLEEAESATFKRL